MSEKMSIKDWYEYSENHNEEDCERKAAETVCTMCGNPFHSWDIELDNNRHEIVVGFPSKHEYEKIRINLCVNCFDN